MKEQRASNNGRGTQDLAHILIAEDEPSVRDFVIRALETQGHECKGVEDGGAALSALEIKPYDLLLTDIVMPVMDGIALALKASALYPDLKILLMTGFAHERQRAHNLDALVHEVVSKPFTLDEINKAVERTLAC